MWAPVSKASSSFRFRGRAGLAYRSIDSADQFSLDWGVSIEGSLRTGQDTTDLSIGFEGRVEAEDDGADLLPLDESGMEFTDLRLGIAVPMSSSNKIGIGVLVPLDGNEERTPQLTLTGNWSLLLQGQ
jgi:hypothetical protein